MKLNLNVVVATGECEKNTLLAKVFHLHCISHSHIMVIQLRELMVGKTAVISGNKLNKSVGILRTYPDLESNEAAKFLPDFPKLPERRKLSGALILSGEAKQEQKYKISLIAK